MARRRQLLWLGLLPLLLGSSRRLVSSAWLLQEGCHAGLGRGEAGFGDGVKWMGVMICAHWMGTTRFSRESNPT